MEDLESETEVSVEKGTYTVEVLDARSSGTSSGGSMVWMDLKIVGGPDDGSVVAVSVNLPRDGEKGVFFLRKRLRGFTPQIRESGASKLPDEEQADVIAQALIGVRVEADLSIQTGGTYDGRQQLDETRQIVDVTPPVRSAPAENTSETTAAVDVGTQTTMNAAATEPLDPPF